MAAQPKFHLTLAITNMKSLLRVMLDHGIPPTDEKAKKAIDDSKAVDPDLWHRLDVAMLQWILQLKESTILLRATRESGSSSSTTSLVANSQNFDDDMNRQNSSQEEVVALATMASVVGKVLAVAIADNSSNDKLLGNGHGSKVLLGLCRHVHIPHIVGPSPMQLKGHNSLVSLDPGHCKQHLMLSHPA
ncbi:hypothetical protein D0Y65_006347 [Glycine soja]|uniref:Uncharacterized protein n=1 Tax=Glycine soja TaxID=3848 RepID=A0A445L8M9_GLYSO|nr:hypothetical protein D0Y65_006347 [Glycine soja]